MLKLNFILYEKNEIIKKYTIKFVIVEIANKKN